MDREFVEWKDDDYITHFVDKEFLKNKSLERLVRLLDVFYYNESAEEHHQPQIVAELAKENSYSVIGIFPTAHFGSIWYGYRMVAALDRGIIKTGIIYDKDNFGTFSGFHVTECKIKRYFWGLSKLPEKQRICVYFNPYP